MPQPDNATYTSHMTPYGRLLRAADVMLTIASDATADPHYRIEAARTLVALDERMAALSPILGPVGSDPV